MNRLLPLSLSLLLLPLFTFLASSCRTTADPAAEKLLSEARALSESPVRRDRESALLLLDSLHKAFPTEVSLRKEAIRLSRLLRLGMSTEDSLLFATEYARDSALLSELDPLFIRSGYPGMPADVTVMRYKGYEPKDATGALFLDILLRHDASLQIVAGCSGSKIPAITCLKAEDPVSGDYETGDTIPVTDAGRNYRFTTGGITRARLTLSQEASERIAAFVALKESEGAALRFSLTDGGDKVIRSFALTPREAEAIRETYRFYAAYVEMKSLEEKMQRHALYRNRLRSEEAQEERALEK